MGCSGQAQKNLKEINCRNAAGNITGRRSHGGSRRHHIARGTMPRASATCAAWRGLRIIVRYTSAWWPAFAQHVVQAASRGPTTIVTPKSQFRTCPSDHGKTPSNIAPLAVNPRQRCIDSYMHRGLTQSRRLVTPSNTDPNNTKQENKYEVKPQYEELSKQINMQHATNQCYECMRAIKDRIARPASQLAIKSIEPLYHAQQVSRWKSSVRDLQDPSAHHSSVVFRHEKSVGHHSDDSIGLFRHNKSVGQSQHGSQSGHQSICQAQYDSINFTNCNTYKHRIHISRSITSITAMFTLKAVKSAQFVPSIAEINLNRFLQGTVPQLKQVSFFLISKILADTSCELKSRNSNQQNNQRTSLYEDTATSHFFSNVDSGLQMGSNRKSNS
ncbi:hypothetical protein F511_39012 [Dorcoceras hygrometricum]|uniref:Uncharacterized protein n=1 Tax=Dorcoceras hygrometricum TaxID=472368 RepID=A0A2Z7CHS3_9LAMI|nr:hypothetical protein F511_39012 [Dorcoceras hygrometricum]